MAGAQSKPNGPDFLQGVSIDDIRDGGMVGGVVGDESVLPARCANEFFAIGATCSHYGGPLAEGLIVGDTVRCPWHHACFSLRTGEAVAAPALNPMSCWRVETRDGKVSCATKSSWSKNASPAKRGLGLSKRSCRDPGRGRCRVCRGRYATARRVWW
jgi:nitrite reductase/ring-hydroxylating ferredoxin subunit